MNVGAVDNTSNLMRYASGTNATSEKTKAAAAAADAASATNFASQANANASSDTNPSPNTKTASAPTTQKPSATSSQSAQPDGSGNAKAPTADYNTFIKLLVAQMKNQDPTKPMDSTEFVSQLASFSAVEQQTQTNTKLETINKALNTISVDGQISRAEGYVGKYLSYTDEKGVVTEGSVQSVTIFSDGLIARLDNGSDLVIGPGVTVTNSKPAAAKG